MHVLRHWKIIRNHGSHVRVGVRHMCDRLICCFGWAFRVHPLRSWHVLWLDWRHHQLCLRDLSCWFLLRIDWIVSCEPMSSWNVLWLHRGHRQLSLWVLLDRDVLSGRGIGLHPLLYRQVLWLDGGLHQLRVR